MTQEDKELLLKDLCARLSYGVKLQCGGVLIGKTHQRYMKERCDAILYSITEVYDNCYVINARYDLIEVKPYLRSMSSMTEEERIIWENLDNYNYSILDYENARHDFLVSHHFDYRGLIEKGLAIAVTENNNPYKVKL